MDTETLKKTAGQAAAQRVRSGQHLGLGSGSTVRFFLEALQHRIEAGELEAIAGVPTSMQTETLARRLGLPLGTLDAHPQLDLTVDGADEVDPQLNLIKGLGGALLREKIVAASSRRLLVIVDEAKQVQQLGQHVPLPVEVLPFGWRATQRALQALGGRTTLRLQQEKPFMTDQQNFILDTHFGEIADPEALAAALEAIPGVLGHGLFLGMAHEVIVGTSQGARVLKGEA